MIKIEDTEVFGWDAAIRGMRNPLESWGKSDSCYSSKGEYIIGIEDKKLMNKLANAGSDHRKFMRMITVYCDITAPLYWWKEFDTYKVGTVRNSCSTMHKLGSRELTLKDFSCDNLNSRSITDLIRTVNLINSYREEWNDPLNNCNHKLVKDIWWQMIQLLPSSYNQRATVMMNYEVLRNMYHSRVLHKLNEWREFCEWIESLPMSELLIGRDKK